MPLLQSPPVPVYYSEYQTTMTTNDTLIALFVHSFCFQFHVFPSQQPQHHAIACINQFINGRRIQALMIHIGEFLQSLFFLASEDDPKVSKNMCWAGPILVS